MAKILACEASAQLSLSFDNGKLSRTNLRSLRDMSPELFNHIMRKLQEQFAPHFEPVSHRTLVQSIRRAGLCVRIRTGARDSVSLGTFVLDVVGGDNPHALVALDPPFKGLPRDVETVCLKLIDSLRIRLDLRTQLSANPGGWITAKVAIDPITKIRIGARDDPPMWESFVLRHEVEYLLTQLDAKQRPHLMLPSAVA